MPTLEKQPLFSKIDLTNATERWKEAIYVTNSLFGLRTFTPSDLQRISKAYEKDLQNGITKKDESSLAMIDTLLPPVDIKELPIGKKVLVIEIGGTNIRKAYISKNYQGNLIEEEYSSVPIGEKNYPNADAFFNHVIDLLEFSPTDEQPVSIGFIWSFPGTAQKRTIGIGVDIISDEELPKEFIIPGISKKPVGEILLTKLQEKFGWGQNLPIAVMNDTRAASGAIDGTGFNIDFGLYNTESGGFDKVNQKGTIPIVYQIVDRNSAQPGKQLAEKQISGQYLEEAINFCILFLQKVDLAMPQIPSQKTAFISGLLGKNKYPSEIHKLIPDATTQAMFIHIAHVIRTASAQLVGTMIGTGIKHFAKIYPNKIVDFPVEGSVFWGIPGYKQIAEECANNILKKIGKTINFQNIEHAGIKGAGMVALSLIK